MLTRYVFRPMTCALLGCTMSVGAAQAQLSNDVVKIGVLTDLGGTYAAATGPGSVVAVKMAVEDFGSKVLGKPIEVIAGDHQGKPDIGVALARRWIDVDKVDAIADVPGSNVALAVQHLTREKNIALLISGSGTTELIGKSCSPTTVLYVFDTYSLAKTSAKAAVDALGKSFFFITLDSAFGTAIESSLTKLITEAGGKVIGTVKHPVGMLDFSSMVLQAQSSMADVVVLANGAGDASNALKTASEYGVKQNVMAMIFLDTDVHAAGLNVAKGLVVPTPFYRSRTETSAAWSRRYFERMGTMPNFSHAGAYSYTLNYLKAIEAAGTDDSLAVVARMKQTPIDDMFAKGQIRADGKFVFDQYLVRVKSPAESQGPWDYFKLIETVPGDIANPPLEQGGCPLAGGQAASVSR
ncbi:ABC transporter substrate-binding protein [Chelatococcus reniformis]|uniref:ABC transporter substrate-binding protein n=1 Tax=Chelatococcus reniformis TaxID=1494448 RepID=A0A916UWH2_9HYPH|nr:ABC transporter substrate-binding protein [Chelatococcus reniformis]